MEMVPRKGYLMLMEAAGGKVMLQGLERLVSPLDSFHLCFMGCCSEVSYTCWQIVSLSFKTSSPLYEALHRFRNLKDSMVHGAEKG